MKKIANSLFGATNCRTNLKIFNHILYKIQIERGTVELKKCQLLYFGAHIVGRFGHIGGSANRPTIDRFEKFWTISYTKYKFTGGPFYEKNCQLMYLMPHFAGRFWKMGGLPIGPESADLKNFHLFITQNQNLEGVCFMKKMPTLVFRGPYCGPFWTYWGVCQSAQNCPILKFLNFFLHKI